MVHKTVLIPQSIQQQISRTSIQYYPYFFETIQPKKKYQKYSSRQGKTHFSPKNSFLLSVVLEWNKLDQNIWNSKKMNFFKKNFFFRFISPFGSNVFRCHNYKRVKLLTKLRLCQSHLWQHKFKHGFLDSLNSICSSSQDIKTSTSTLFLLFQRMIVFPKYYKKK